MSELTDPEVVIRALHFAAERQFRAKLLAAPLGIPSFEWMGHKEN